MSQGLQIATNSPVKVTLNNGEVYQGLYVGGTSTSVELLDVVDQSGQNLVGTYIFYRQEIARVQVQHQDNHEENVDEALDDQAIEPQQSDYQQELERLEDLAMGANVIDKDGSDLNKAVALLQESSSVGLVCLGAQSTIKLIVIANRRHIFLFDVIDFNATTFPQPLRLLLEDKNQLKILHGAQWPKENLHKNFGVELQNIYDTQHWDTLIYKQDKRNLSDSIEDVLKASKSLLFKAEETNKKPEKWGQRPLPDTRRLSAALLSAFLVPLKMGLENQFLKNIHESTKSVYDFYRNLDALNYAKMIHDNKCPEEIWNLIKK